MKKAISVLLACILLCSLGVPALADGPDAAAPADAADESASQAARWAAENGVIDGGSDFRSLEDCSRAEAVTMLWKAAGSPVINYLMTWSDVDEESDYSEAVRWASGEGIVNGVGGGRFDPERAVTREEAAVILYRYVQKQGGGFVGSWMFLLQYDDADQVSEWADEAVHWTTMKGYLTAAAGNCLDPKGPASNGVVVDLLYGVFGPRD